jgi:hypothetical protein
MDYHGDILALAEKMPPATCDPEGGHYEADQILIEAVERLAGIVDALLDHGLVGKATGTLVERYRAIGKWYS